MVWAVGPGSPKPPYRNTYYPGVRSIVIQGGREMSMPTVWTEVLGEGLAVTWLWHQESLLQVPYALDGYHLRDDDLGALSRYAQDKEFDLLVERRFDQADFDGTLEEYVKEELATA